MVGHSRADVRICWFSFQIVVKPWIHFFPHLSFSGKALCHELRLVVRYLNDGQVGIGFRPALHGL